MLIFFKSIIFLFTFVGYANSQGGFKVNADNTQVQEDGEVSVDVLKNDKIVNKDNLLLEITVKPEKGTAVVQDDKILYTPSTDVNGIDQFEYKVDIGTGTGTALVRVNINPVNDSPVGISLSETKIKENAPAGTAVGRINVDDPDQDDVFKFGLAKENRGDFSLDGSNLLTKKPFNYEENKSFSIALQVTDSGGEKYVGNLDIDVENENEAPLLIGKKKLSFAHSENAGKIVSRLTVEDPDENQKSVKFKISKSADKQHFKITRSGDIAFLRDPDFEQPLDKDKNNVYEFSYTAHDSKDDKLYVSGDVVIEVKDAAETEVVALDKRKYIAWNVDHQPYHILMEDAIANYMRLKYVNSGDNSAVDDGYGTPIKEMEPTDQIIMVQEKGNADEIHEIWYGNGLDFIVIDREKVDWIFSQDIQRVLIAKDEYLTSDSEMVFHESERDRLMAGYGSNFSVWHVNNFRISLSSLSLRSNLLQYSSNMRVGNKLIGLPGALAGSGEVGVATHRSEFGLRVPVTFDFGTGSYEGFDVFSADYLGLYARGNIDNLFETKTSMHGLIGFTFYPSSSGDKYTSLDSVDPSQRESIDYVNILDSYALVATTVRVPVKLSFVGRLTASPGFHYMKVAHRFKIDSGEELYERTFYQDQDLNDGNSFTRLSSFYMSFDLVGQIGEKPRFIERLSFMDFVQLSKVPFYELSLQYISSLNMITSLNLNLTDDIGVSISSMSKNSSLKGNWMPETKFWFGINYRANF